MPDKLHILIMAGGLGKRMNSQIPKVLHPIGGIPMLVHIIKKAFLISQTEPLGGIHIIVGKYAPIVQKTLEEYLSPSELSYIRYANQPEPLGTGHAILCALPNLLGYSRSDRVLVLSGDVPLIEVETLDNLLATYDSNEHIEAVIMTTVLENPTGNGRIQLNSNGCFHSIVEEKDCNHDQKLIKLCNSGIYVFRLGSLIQNIPLIRDNNAQKEFYLTDVFPLIALDNNGNSCCIELFVLPQEQQYQLLNINNPDQLYEADQIFESSRSRSKYQ